MSLDHILKNNENWANKKIELDKDYFKNLAKGQSPEILYIGCSDSRVAAEQLMGLEPGDVFIHRNVANQASPDDLNFMSVLNYAVVHLKVNHIVVCGHTSCGGVRAALTQEDLGILNPWIKKIKNVKDENLEKFNSLNELEAEKLLIELNVKKQCKNISEVEFVADAVKNRQLKIHSWVFDLSSGKILVL
jgi:carbonic anhydrase